MIVELNRLLFFMCGSRMPQCEPFSQVNTTHRKRPSAPDTSSSELLKHHTETFDRLAYHRSGNINEYPIRSQHHL